MALLVRTRNPFAVSKLLVPGNLGVNPPRRIGLPVNSRMISSALSRNSNLPCENKARMIADSSFNLLPNSLGNQLLLRQKLCGFQSTRGFSHKKEIETEKGEQVNFSMSEELAPIQVAEDNDNEEDWKTTGQFIRLKNGNLVKKRKKNFSKYFLGKKPMSWKEHLKQNYYETPSSIRRAKDHDILFREVKLKKYSIPGSPSKLNLIARMVRRMNAADAMDQLRYAKQRKANDIMMLLHRCIRKAKERFGLDREDLIVAVIEVGKGKYEKRLNFHSRGRAGVRHLKSCHLTIVLRESPTVRLQGKGKFETWVDTSKEYNPKANW
uniref:50S ribosomal protein L22, chloroplastic n=1 Tax=Aplanochytrium stocchinoi TaxID=215587 RepID=A0A7S3PLW7_9STRA|mmetsp:Transcript_9910/g.12351  ORF Transcript_9910/g.12351 Transcript_9910/m.12351 type:complete len:323 (+) Transcript_9910:149-1117(+)